MGVDFQVKGKGGGGKGKGKGSPGNASGGNKPSGGTLQDKLNSLTKLSSAMSGVGSLQLKRSGSGVAAYVAGQPPAWVSPKWLNGLIADAANTSPQAANKLQEALGKFAGLQAAVQAFYGSPGVDTSAVSSAMDALAEPLAAGLSLLQEANGGAPTASWTNSDETPIEPGPDMKTMSLKLGAVANFGREMADHALGGQGAAPLPGGMAGMKGGGLV